MKMNQLGIPSARQMLFLSSLLSKDSDMYIIEHWHSSWWLLMAIFLKGVRYSTLFLSVYIHASTSRRLIDLGWDGGEWHKDQRLIVEHQPLAVRANNARHVERRNYQLSRSRLCILMLLILLWLSCMLRYGSSSSSSTLSIWADVNNMKDILRFFSFFVFIAFCFCRRLLIVSNKSSLVDFTYLIFSWHFNNKSNAGRTN